MMQHTEARDETRSLNVLYLTFNSLLLAHPARHPTHCGHCIAEISPYFPKRLAELPLSSPFKSATPGPRSYFFSIWKPTLLHASHAWPSSSHPKTPINKISTNTEECLLNSTECRRLNTRNLLPPYNTNMYSLHATTLQIQSLDKPPTGNVLSTTTAATKHPQEQLYLIKSRLQRGDMHQASLQMIEERESHQARWPCNNELTNSELDENFTGLPLTTLAITGRYLS